MTTAPEVAEELLPPADRAFHVEQHGTDWIPDDERWASPRAVGAMWAGASVQIEYFVYGAILMTFGFTFAQALSLIILGNLSYVLLGICSLQGPDAGTTVFAINRAGFGPNGSRLMSLFNWLTQIGFEVEGLILIVGAAVVLSDKAGLHPGTPAKVAFVVAAVAVQAVLPFLGHATLVKSLRWLILPFVVMFAVILGLGAGHVRLDAVPHGAGWATYMAGLAFTITLGGLGWTECGNDYTRYVPREESRAAIVWWVTLGSGVPQVLVMTAGALVATFLDPGGAYWNSAFPFAAFAHQQIFPGPFVVVFLVFAMTQLFAINSLDLYSSGVTLQALGIGVRRYVAVLIDSAVGLVVTLYAVFNSSFSTYMKDFVDVVIVWIAPWVAIFLVDWALRRFRYVPAELQRTGRDGLYWRTGGVHWPAIAAQLIGMLAALAALAPTFHVPTWVNPLSAHSGGADFSVFTGMAAGGGAYWALARRGVRRQADRQDELLGGGAHAATRPGDAGPADRPYCR